MDETLHGEPSCSTDYTAPMSIPISSSASARKPTDVLRSSIAPRHLRSPLATADSWCRTKGLRVHRCSAEIWLVWSVNISLMARLLVKIRLVWCPSTAATSKARLRRDVILICLWWTIWQDQPRNLSSWRATHPVPHLRSPPTWCWGLSLFPSALGIGGV